MNTRMAAADSPRPAEAPGAELGDFFVYRSQAMAEVARLVRKALASDATVLILGETGCGKELVAQAIHRLGRRRDRPLVAQNAGALPDTLLESELFGHARGAFSGAVGAKPGLLEAADGGTVFLDEIGEASAALQVGLLRFLERGTFRRVGEVAERRSDVRVVAATHRDLEAEVAAGRFRADLYYRLSVFPIRLPPLRERPEDVPLLAERFLAELGARLGRRLEPLGPLSLARLMARPWKGNVRELKNTLHRLALLSSNGIVEVPAAGGDGAEEAAGAGTCGGGVLTLEEVERNHIRTVCAQVGGNQSRAADLLGMKRSTLRFRMAKLGLL
jgi:transcriptional regulator with GAF, ATPase, and Fis domain